MTSPAEDFGTFTLTGISGRDRYAAEKLLERVAGDDILGQLLERSGSMRALGSEEGQPKLDWVDGVELALDHPEWLAACEQEALDILRRGIRHVIWAGMGGSVQTVHVLARLGLADRARLHFYPCDGTDPAGLNRILADIAAREGLEPSSSGALRTLLERTLMIGVAMGMTSEEPITHLQWFDGLLAEHGVADPGSHIEVMTLPDSYLDRFASGRGSRRVPLQLDGQNGTGGRMSAPATRVFIRPVALGLVADAIEADVSFRPDGSLLQPLLANIQELYGVSRHLDAPDRRAFVHANPFIRLGALVAARARAGHNQVALATPPRWRGFEPWLEQLVEESLGKGGKGFCLFYGGQDWSRVATDPLVLALGEAPGTVRIGLPSNAHATERGAALALAGGLFAGFKLTVATFGYLEGITFAGQPGVEAYKAYARRYRGAEGAVEFGEADVRTGTLELHTGSLVRSGLVTAGALEAEVRRLGASTADVAGRLAAVLSLARSAGPGGRPLRYLDLTFNGEPTAELQGVLERARARLANEKLRVPCKLRTGPSDYHSTEQSEVDGPDELVSIRMIALSHDAPLAGAYTDKFLLAQARGTWQAMEDARRWVVMLTTPRLDAAALAALESVFESVAELIA